MERYAWKARVLPGKLQEYERRHRELWPEMKEMLREAGVCNYSIFSDGELLFGYYECKFGAEVAARVQAESAAAGRWNAYMQDVLDMAADPETGAQPRLFQVFRFDE